MGRGNLAADARLSLGNHREAEAGHEDSFGQQQSAHLDRLGGLAQNDWNALTGYQVTDKVYGKLGALESVEEYPQQIIGKCIVNGKEVLFPLNENFISEINAKKRELHLDLPDGLLDVYR